MINIETIPSDALPMTEDDQPNSPACVVELVDPPGANVVSGGESDSGNTTISGDLYTEPRNPVDETPRPVKVQV